MGRAQCRKSRWGDIFRSTAVVSLVLVASSNGVVVEIVVVVVDSSYQKNKLIQTISIYLLIQICICFYHAFISMPPHWNVLTHPSDSTVRWLMVIKVTIGWSIRWISNRGRIGWASASLGLGLAHQCALCDANGCMRRNITAAQSNPTPTGSTSIFGQ